MSVQRRTGRRASAAPPPRRRPHRPGARAVTAAVLAVAAGVAMTGCGGGASAGGKTTLTWYVNSASASEETIAKRCSQASDTYTIATSLLPNNAAAQREQLLRRLAANDSTVDVMSLDPPYMAEFANAKFLRPYTKKEAAEFSDGVLKGALEQSVFDGTMYAAPYFGNTQLLWYKKSVAEKAGLDMSEPVTWDQVIAAAEKTGTTVDVQGRKNESLTVWVNALVQSAGGQIIDPSSQGKPSDEAKIDINSKAGAEAARIMETIARSPAAPSALSTAGEEESRAAFQSDNGGFMVNWPYVWAAFTAAEKSGDLAKGFSDDVGWTRYPRVLPDTPSATPLGGASVAIGSFTKHPDLAVEAVRCIRSPENQVEHMLVAGDPGVSAQIFDDPKVREAFPMWKDIKEGLTVAAPRPVSAYYGDVTGVIQQGYHPPNTLSPKTTPEKTAELMRGVLDNTKLL